MIRPSDLNGLGAQPAPLAARRPMVTARGFDTQAIQQTRKVLSTAKARASEFAAQARKAASESKAATATAGDHAERATGMAKKLRASAQRSNPANRAKVGKSIVRSQIAQREAVRKGASAQKLATAAVLASSGAKAATTAAQLRLKAASLHAKGDTVEASRLNAKAYEFDDRAIAHTTYAAKLATAPMRVELPPSLSEDQIKKTAANFGVRVGKAGASPAPAPSDRALRAARVLLVTRSSRGGLAGLDGANLEYLAGVAEGFYGADGDIDHDAFPFALAACEVGNMDGVISALEGVDGLFGKIKKAAKKAVKATTKVVAKVGPALDVAGAAVGIPPGVLSTAAKAADKGLNKGGGGSAPATAPVRIPDAGANTPVDLPDEGWYASLPMWSKVVGGVSAAVLVGAVGYKLTR